MLTDSNEEVQGEDVVFSEIDAENSKQQAVGSSTPEVDNVPEKYKGKSVSDIVRMHQEAEKLIGRQAQEVGEVRRLADGLIKQQISKHQTPPQAEEDDLDFFEDPKKAVEKAVKNHPDMIAARQAASQMRAQQTQQALVQKHPDFAAVVQDGEFIEWVKASPYRLNMYQQADQSFDLGAADELISTFKQIRTSRGTKAKEAGDQIRKDNLKAASVNVSGTGESSKKVYRRADLIRLMMTDPDRYNANQPEIMAAYADGRVR